MFRKIGVFILALLLLSGCANAAGYDDCAEDGELKDYIRELCAAYGVPETMVFAVIEKESSWNAEAVNYNETCFGLMQIHVINFPWLEDELGLDNPKEPYQNVQAGIYMLSGYIEKYIDYHMALMCYNCGEAGARQLWQEGSFTNAYSRWVVERMDELEWEALDAARDALAAQYQETQITVSEEGVFSIEDVATSAVSGMDSIELNTAAEQALDFEEPFPDATTALSPDGAMTAHTFYAEDAISKNVGYVGTAGICAAQPVPRYGMAVWCKALLRWVVYGHASRCFAAWACR